MTGDTLRPYPEPSMTDVLNYAITSGLLLTIILTATLIWAGTPPWRTVLIMAVLGSVWTFTITPHLVAYWVDRDVDELLDTLS